MKKINHLILLFFLAILFPCSIKADTWKVFEFNFTYVNSSISLGGQLPKDRYPMKAFRVANGKTLVTMSGGLPLVINLDGSFSPEYNADFEALDYMPSPLASVVVDANGKLYFQNTHIIASFNDQTGRWQGINVRTGKNTGTIPSPECENIFGMTFDKDNNLFVTGTKDGKPVVAILQNSVWKVIPASEELMQLWREDKEMHGKDAFDIVLKGSGLKDSFILTSPVLSADGSIWMAKGAAKSKGLVRFMNGEMQNIQSKALKGLITDYKGNVLYATDREVGIIEANTTVFKPLVTEPVTAVFADKEGLWYATPPSVNSTLTAAPTTYMKRYDFATQKTKEYTSANTPISSAIKEIYGDAKGNIAFVAFSGLYTIDKSDFSKYTGKWSQFSAGYMDDLDFLKINSVSLNKRGKYPTSVSYDSFNNRWVGVYENNKWNYYKMAVDVEAGKGFGLKGTYPNCSAYTSKGIFIGTDNDGLMLFDPSAEKAVNVAGYDNKKFGKDVRSIVEDKQGNIWVGTNKGLLKYDGSAFTLLDKKSGMKSDKINCLLISPNGTLWVGTGGDGVYSFDGTEWKAYTKKEGLKEENVGSLTNIGETIYSGSQNTFKANNKLYTIENGTVKEEELAFSMGSNALDSDEKGNLWIFGAKRGIICHKADGTKQTYDSSNSPIGYQGEGILSYSMRNGYCFGGKAYITSSYDPLADVRDKNYTRPPGGDPFAKSPLEQLAEKYSKKANTFDGTVVSFIEIE